MRDRRGTVMPGSGTGSGNASGSRGRISGGSAADTQNATGLSAKLALLGRVGFIAQLPQRQRHMLALVSTVRLCAEGAVLVEQHVSDRRALVVVCEGQAAVSFKNDPENSYEDPKLVRVEDSPSVFGEDSLLSGEESTETVCVTGGPAMVLQLDGRDFDKVLASDEAAERALELRKEAREARVLDKVPLLQGLQATERAQMLRSMQCISFLAEERILEQNTPGHCFFVILKGSVIVKRQDSDSEIVRKHAYEFFGEQALLHDRPRAADVISVGRVVCLFLHRNALSAALRRRLLAHSLEATVHVRNEVWLSGLAAAKEDEEERKHDYGHAFRVSVKECRRAAASLDVTGAHPRRAKPVDVYHTAATSATPHKFGMLCPPPPPVPGLSALRLEARGGLCARSRTTRLEEKSPSSPPARRRRRTRAQVAAAAATALTKCQVSDDVDLLARSSRLARRARSAAAAETKGRRSAADVELLALLLRASSVACKTDVELQRLELVRFDEGEPLFREGDAAPGWLLVLQGSVALSTESRLRSHQHIGSAGPGATLGELSVLDPRVFGATLYAATATAPVEALLLRREDADPSEALLRDLSELQARMAHVLPSARALEPNLHALVPLASRVKRQHFAKDFVFISPSLPFDVGFVHFIAAGSVGVFRRLPKPKGECAGQWAEVSRLGEGEVLCIGRGPGVGGEDEGEQAEEEEEEEEVLAALTRVLTVRLPVALLELVDPEAVAEMRDASAARSRLRATTLANIVEQRVALGAPSFALRVLSGDPVAPPQAAEVPEAPQRVTANAKLGLLGSQSRRKNKEEEKAKAKEEKERREEEEEHEEYEGKEDRRRSRVLDRARIKSALGVIAAHYSVNVRERHLALCGHEPRSDAHHDVSHDSAGIAAARRHNKDGAANGVLDSEPRAVELRARRKQRGTARPGFLAQETFARPTRNWRIQL